MTSHDWFVENRVFYATRTLDPEDEQTFRDHLGRCEACRAAVAEFERETGWLPMAVDPVKPRPGFRWQVANAVLGVRRPSRWIQWLPLAAAAALGVVSVGLARRGAAREEVLSTQLAQTERSLASLSDTVAMLRRAARILQANIEMDGKQGGLVIFADSVSHRWNVVMHGLPPAPAGERYQFWFICADGMVRGAEIVPVPGKPAFATLEMPERGGGVLGASLSMEPLTNASDIPRGKELAHLML